MKRYTHIACMCWFTLALFAQDAKESRGVEIEISGGAGWASYEEKVSIVPVQSDWDAPTGTVRIQGVLIRCTLDLYGEVRLTGSATGTETWKDSGIPVQQNDLTYGGTSLRAGIRFPALDAGALMIQSRLGLVAGYEEYERSNFFFLREGGTLFTLNQDVTESVFSIGPAAGLTVTGSLHEKFTLGFETEFAWMATTTAENTGFDVEIDGDGGWKWSSQIALLVDLKKEGQSMGLSVRYDLQELNGDTLTQSDAIFEWPDNTLEQASVELYWVNLF